MPVLSVVIPRLKSNQLKWTFTGAFEVSDGLFPSSVECTLMVYIRRALES